MHARLGLEHQRHFHWALSKLLATLVDTIGPFCDHPSIVDGLYVELQRIVLRSYGLSEHHIVKWQMVRSSPLGEQSIGPNGSAQHPEAHLGGRDPEGPLPPQDGRLRMGYC